MSSVMMYIKGMSVGSTGQAGIGVIICDHWGRIIKKIEEFIGNSSSLKAEFRALMRGIEEIRDMNALRVKIFSDNEQMIKQMTGVHKVKTDELEELLEQIKALSKGVSMEFIQIHPVKNRDAEKLAREVIEKNKPKQENINRKDFKNIDLRAVKAVVERAILLEEYVKDEKISPSPGNTFQSSSDLHKPELQKFSRPEEDLCPDEKEERQISAGGVVYKREGQRVKICIIGKKNKRIWALPKGRIIPGENLEETAKREIAEETGHLADVKEKVDEVNYHFYWKEQNVFYHKTVYFFLMPVVKENYCNPDGEAEKIIWLTIGEAYKKLTYINEKEVLRKAQKIIQAL